MDHSENSRLQMLSLLEILDSPAEQAYDDFALLASEICETPVALVSLVDDCRQWFKANIGFDGHETPREVSFCSVALERSALFVVEDARLDPRFASNPLVTQAPFIRFYAGMPLAFGNQRVGTLCVIDHVPRVLNLKQMQTLEILAKHIVTFLEFRYFEKKRQLAEKALAEQKLQIIATSKMSALGEMASGIAHEINNPLAVIMARAGYICELLEASGPKYEKVVRAGHIIEKTCERITKTIDALRTFARDDAHEPHQPVSTTKLIDDVLPLCNEKFKEGVRLTVVNEAPGVLVFCRPIQISQVLLNLLLNAYDAVQSSEDKWVSLKLARHESRIEISVIDSGPGVEPDVRKRIMEPFFTTKPVGKGTGIGLSISHKIIQSHESELRLDERHQPTRFFFSLALVEAT